MKRFKVESGILMVAISLAVGIGGTARAVPSADQPADVKSGLEKLRFLVGRFTLKSIGGRSSDASGAGMTIESSFTPDGTSLRQVVHNNGTDSAERIWTYDPDKHVYTIKSSAEGDNAPETTGQFEGDTLVLQQVYPPFGSTGLQPNVHDGVIEVARVFRGGAADKAGLRKGDVITKIDGKELTGMEYPNSLLTGSPDTDVVVTVRRKGVEKDYTLHRQRASMSFRRTLSPRRGGGYRQVVYRTDVSGVPKAGSDAIPVGR